jgi:uncharacterized protein (DUF302 family)
MLNTSRQYGHLTITSLAFDDAVNAAKKSLASAGFGVLCEIDVSKTLKDKLGVDEPRTLILGSCNPGFAHKAMTAEPGVALFLPCNVVVRQLTTGVEVSAVDANAMMGFIGNPALAPIAAEVDQRLIAVIAAIPA